MSAFGARADEEDASARAVAAASGSGAESKTAAKSHVDERTSRSGGWRAVMSVGGCSRITWYFASEEEEEDETSVYMVVASFF